MGGYSRDRRKDGEDEIAMSQETHGIAFNRVALTGKELEYAKRVLQDGHLAGDGPFTERCSVILQQATGSSRVLLTPSCTHALEMAALLLDIHPGDEVIVPSFTFVSTVNAFVLRGARPIFIDIRPDTLNMDELLLEELITEKTRAIVPVHYAGVGCEMDTIGETASNHGIPVVEDNAQGLFGQYRGKALGSFGSLSAVSFHETKNITCGEGGALFINDESLIERAEIIREKGTDRAQFFRGQVDKYTWRSVGSSYLLSDILAAVLLAQLEEREAIQRRRKEIWEIYLDGLKDWAMANGVGLPTVPAHCSQTYHMFYLLMPSSEVCTAFIAEMKRKSIQVVSHYEPLHMSPMGTTWEYEMGSLPVTEDVSARLVRLPLHLNLSPDDMEMIRNRIHDFRP